MFGVSGVKGTPHTPHRVNRVSKWSNILIALEGNGRQHFEAFVVKEFDNVLRVLISPQQAAPVSLRVSLKQTVKTLRIMFAGQGVGAYQIIGHHPARCPPKEWQWVSTF